jgi:L-lactate utilization protein LutC
MAKTKNTPTNRDEAAAEQPKQPNHTDTIKSQVLAKIGKLPRFDHVAISALHNGKYRVNIWQQTEPDKNIAITTGLRIGLSYYLTVSDTGEIIHSNPPMTKLGSQV